MALNRAVEVSGSAAGGVAGARSSGVGVEFLKITLGNFQGPHFENLPPGAEKVF